MIPENFVQSVFEGTIWFFLCAWIFFLVVPVLAFLLNSCVCVFRQLGVAVAEESYAGATRCVLC